MDLHAVPPWGRKRKTRVNGEHKRQANTRETVMREIEVCQELSGAQNGRSAESRIKVEDDGQGLRQKQCSLEVLFDGDEP